MSPPLLLQACCGASLCSQRCDADFQRALQIDPANSAAKAELLAVEQALKAQSAPEQVRVAAISVGACLDL